MFEGMEEICSWGWRRYVRGDGGDMFEGMEEICSRVK